MMKIESRWLRPVVIVTCAVMVNCIAAPKVVSDVQSTDENGGSKERSWEIRDSVSVRYFVRSTSYHGVSSMNYGSDPVVASPDGEHFFFVTRHGDLQSDSSIYEMQIFAARDIRESLAADPSESRTNLEPLQKLTFRTQRSDRPGVGISQASWADNRTVLFAGVQGQERRKPYQFNIQSRTLEKLSSTCDDVDLPDLPIRARAGSILLLCGYGYKPWSGHLDTYPMNSVRGSDLAGVISDDMRKPSGVRLQAGFEGGELREIGKFDEFWGGWISPNGKWAFGVAKGSQLVQPDEWANYELGRDGGHNRFVLIDLRTGHIESAIDAPVGTVTAAGSGVFPQVFWSDDSQSAILVNTALPLSENDDKRRRSAYVVDYRVPSGRWSVLESIVDDAGAKVKSADWLEEGVKLLVTRQSDANNDAIGSIYEFDRGRWRARSTRNLPNVSAEEARTSVNGLSVRLREGANEPPVILASDGEREVALTGKDPALIGVRRAPIEEVSWTENSGRTIKGGLMLPKDHADLTPLPLVIQACCYEPEHFQPDGVAFGTYAAQTLVSRGFAVLLINTPTHEPSDRNATDPPVVRSPREGPAFVSRVDAAVAELARRKIIDPSRVGIAGFSRAGFMTFYTITHPGRTSLSAAAVFDSYTGSFGLYTQDAAIGFNSAREYERQYGNGTFWENKSGWLEEAPTFNIDRIETPVLFSLHGSSGSEVYALETVGALRISKIAHEFLLLPNAAHQPLRPREQEALMRANVDWMSFWLLDQAPEDPERAVHWEDIRKDWVARRESFSE